MPPTSRCGSAGRAEKALLLYCEACGRCLERQRRRNLFVLACPTHGEWTPNGYIVEKHGLRKIVTTRSEYDTCMGMCRAIDFDEHSEVL